MNYYIAEKNTIAAAHRTAGIKARDDADAIMQKAGFCPITVTAPQDRENLSRINKLLVHFKVVWCWNKAVKSVKAGDCVLLQFPAVNHSIFLDSVIKKLKNKNVKVAALLHDLELLRLSLEGESGAAQSWRLKKEELSVMRLFDKIIVHNDKMLDYINREMGIEKDRLVNLEIFDYLCEIPPQKTVENFRSVIIAGNLNPQKCKYVYNLPENVCFELYGPNFKGENAGNITYHGSFDPKELPFVLSGGFGLVWDGVSADTCTGVWGEYLKYNNPHKTSLYLASGIPVVIWDKAALADFVIKNGCGIAVGSLCELKDRLDKITPQMYVTMRQNAMAVSKKLTDGYFLNKAIGEVC